MWEIERTTLNKEILGLFTFTFLYDVEPSLEWQQMNLYSSAVSGSEKHGKEGVEISHIPPTPTTA